MRQTINDIVQNFILKGRTELHDNRLTRVLYSLEPPNLLTSIFLLGITAVLIFTVFHKSFKSIMRSEVEPQRLGATSSNRMKKDRPFGGMLSSISLSVLSYLEL